MQNGNTIPHIAAHKGHLEVARSVVQEDGKELVSILKKDSRAALDDAMRRKKMSLIAFLEDQ